MFDYVKNLKPYLGKIKKRGVRYEALCPFHKERHPSFTFCPTKGKYYCFGCHRSGNLSWLINDIRKELLRRQFFRKHPDLLYWGEPLDGEYYPCEIEGVEQYLCRADDGCPVWISVNGES